MATAQKLPKMINGVNVNDLFTTIDAIKDTPAIAKFKFRIRNRVGWGQPKSFDRKRVSWRLPGAVAAEALRA